MTTVEVTTGFERVTCSRCGGTGRYSYCQTARGKYGPYTCFKCAGNETVMTKRGLRAYQLFERSLSVPANRLVPGDLVWMRGHQGFATVIESRPGVVSTDGGYYVGKVVHPYSWVVLTTACKYCGMGPEKLIRKAATKEEKAAKLALAYEYQECLTKTGAVRKDSKEKAEQITQQLLTNG